MTRGVKHIVQGTGATAPVSYWGESALVMANEHMIGTLVHSPSINKGYLSHKYQ